MTSPNYPGSYPSSSDCRWLLLSPDPSKQVAVNVTDYETESCCDGLEVKYVFRISVKEQSNILNVDL